MLIYIFVISWLLFGLTVFFYTWFKEPKLKRIKNLYENKLEVLLTFFIFMFLGPMILLFEWLDNHF